MKTKKFSIELSLELAKVLDQTVEQLSDVFPSRNSLIRAIVAAKFGLISAEDVSALNALVDGTSSAIQRSSRTSRRQQAHA